ncbi:unnamed protein product [Peniophora sp. CBMAI 1063]|nr:unnamed protein product [Peniophora sp. CBMAI 1063]
MAFNSDDLPDAPAVDKGSCKLLGTTALIVQALMGVVVISSLLYKRHRETVKRPWRVWFFDVSKQIIGQAFVHGVNVLLSDLGALALAGNACTYYFLNILIDTTLGVGILYAVLHLLTHLFSETLHLKGFESGQYGRPPQWRNWARQLGVYVASLTTMKLAVIGLFFLFPGIFKLGEWALSWLGDSEHGQVVFTMGIFPIIMNVLQFWLIDSIVKASTLPPSTPAPRSPLHPEHEPLFQDPDSESEDDDRRRPDDIEAQRARIPPAPTPVKHEEPSLVGGDDDDETDKHAVAASVRSVAGEEEEVDPAAAHAALAARARDQ